MGLAGADPRLIDEDERELAAALVVAIEAGLLSTAGAIRVVDREMADRPSPGHWMIEASLSGTPQDLLHVLQGVANGHPLLGEIWPLAELSQPLYDVYEEATCAHEHGGVPQAQAVQNALRALFDAGRTCGSQRSAFRRVL